jgi:HEAT repeat protein
LGDLKASPAEPALIALLHDPDSGVREAAATTLGQLKVSTAGPPLVRAAMAEADPETRAAMAWAIGVVGGEGAGPAVRALLGDADTRVRLAAIRVAVKVFPRDEAARLLLAALAGELDYDREEAADALRAVAGPSIEAALVEALHRPENAYRTNPRGKRIAELIADALSAVGTASADDTVQAWRREQRETE